MVSSHLTGSGAGHSQCVDFPQYFTCSVNKKLWTPRSSMHISHIERNIDGSSTPQQQYNSKQAGEHVVGRMYTVNPREEERI